MSKLEEEVIEIPYDNYVLIRQKLRFKTRCDIFLLFTIY